MKPSDTLTTLFNHHLWANVRLLEQCARLTVEQLETTMPGARGSIYETLQHIVNSERSYLSRISTGEPYRRPAEARPMTIGEMIEAVRLSGMGLIEWAAKVQPEDVVEVHWEGAPRSVPKAIILTQAINHATEHREQVKAILTKLGVEPPDLQAWAYFEEMDS